MLSPWHGAGRRRSERSANEHSLPLLKIELSGSRFRSSTRSCARATLAVWLRIVDYEVVGSVATGIGTFVVFELTMWRANVGMCGQGALETLSLVMTRATMGAERMWS